MKRRISKKAKTVLFIIIALMFCIALSNLNCYERKGVVIKSNNQEVTVIDATGNEWEVKAKDFKVNDEVVMKMHDKGTTSIYDDEVKDITKREE